MPEAQKFIDKARGGVLSVAQFASEIKPLLDKARQQYGPRATSTCQSIEESINFYCPTDATTKTKPCPRRNYIPYRQRVQNLAFSKFDPYLHHSNLNEETMKYIRSLYKGELPVNPKPSPNKPVDTETGLPSLNERLNENARRIYQLQLFQHLRAGNPNPTSEPEQALLATTMNATTELILQCDNPKLVQNFHQQTTTPNGFCDESLRPTQNRGHWTHQQDANSKPCQE
ncbi:hypothetical protein Pelo_16412 [Pelomyxa schiedti]|nr:hypothetical protein Pelo_16412 [Pelomyxa schiedti]